MTTAAPVRETENPSLNGKLRAVRDEITALDLDITGTLPTYLDGRYLRIGPNPIGDTDTPPISLVLRRGHGPRSATAGRKGALVSQTGGCDRQTFAEARRDLDERADANGGFDFASKHQHHRTGRQDTRPSSREAHVVRADRRIGNRWGRRISAARCSAGTPPIPSVTR